MGVRISHLLPVRSLFLFLLEVLMDVYEMTTLIYGTEFLVKFDRFSNLRSCVQVHFNKSQVTG